MKLNLTSEGVKLNIVNNGGRLRSIRAEIDVRICDLYHQKIICPELEEKSLDDLMDLINERIDEAHE